MLTEFTPLTPFPGTPLHKKVENEILTTDRQLFDLQHFLLPTETPTRDLYRMMRNAYGRMILRAFFRARLWQGPMWSLQFLKLVNGLRHNFIAFGRAHRDIPQAAPALAE